MLTRLKINGFKNLVNLDLRFGPFTCIAGSNAVGKSNIFDAIEFLSLLSEKPFVEAASLIRNQKDSTSNKTSSIRSIFHRIGNSFSKKISIEVEMIIPKSGQDELGQPAKATYNFLRYSLELEYDDSDRINNRGPIKITKEELIPIIKSTSSKHLLFEHIPMWRNSVLQGKRGVEFISTKTNDESEILINLHQDGGSSGKPKSFLAENLPRTVLSTVSYASETPTVLLAKREMQSWRQLQLEPSAIRLPDSLDKFSYSSKLGSDGSNLPATVYRLMKEQDESIYVQLANSLSELIPDVQSVSIDRDEKRQLLTLMVINKDGTPLPARSLSDGTLRFLALAVLDLDYSAGGLICLEEPENGIYPDRIPAIIELLRSIPVDTNEEDDADNPLRQVIINTHSPRVVYEIPDSSLVFVELKEIVVDGVKCKTPHVSALSNTWRTTKGNMRPIAKGKLLSYFDINATRTMDWFINGKQKQETKIKNREDLMTLQGTLFANE